MRDVVRLTTGIAVVADDTWAAFCGRDALEVVWDSRKPRRLDPETYWKRLEEAGKGGRVTRSQGTREGF